MLSTGAEEQAPTCMTVIQTWLIYLLLLSRGIHYSANHSLANVQYKCHDRHYYIHIDHCWRRKCSWSTIRLAEQCVDTQEFVRLKKKKKTREGTVIKTKITTGIQVTQTSHKHMHTHSHSYTKIIKLYIKLSKVNHTINRACEGDECTQVVLEESGSNRKHTNLPG